MSRKERKERARAFINQQANWIMCAGKEIEDIADRLEVITDRYITSTARLAPQNKHLKLRILAEVKHRIREMVRRNYEEIRKNIVWTPTGFVLRGAI